MKKTVCFRQKSRATLSNCDQNEQRNRVFDWTTARCLAQMSLYGAIALMASSKVVQAQITADETVGTEVNTNSGNNEITGGTTQGANLFHSFQEFSLTTGETAFFNNSTDIANIIGRITGSSSSQINGLIRANGNSNLILINANGIDFGADARLSIGGSFLGSTAEGILFEDGSAFKADGSTTPLLTVSAPVGLQLGQEAAAIKVEGIGHDLSVDTPVFAPFNRGNVSGLKLQTGQTIALVGGEIELKGGVIAAEQGRVELGSVNSGTVTVDPNSDLTLSYENVDTFKDISLTQQSLVDVSGSGNRGVQIQGREITLSDGSAVLLQNSGTQTSGNVDLGASQSLTLTGTSFDGLIGSGLYTEAFGRGKGGDMAISTPQLSVTAGAGMVTFSTEDGASGNIALSGRDLTIAGFGANNPNKFSTISAQTIGKGNGGNINVTAENLTILTGGNIASVTGGTGIGTAGDVQIEAGTIALAGINPVTFASSLVTAGSVGEGNGGNVSLETNNLLIEDGGRVDASATATGNGGNITIDAAESILVTGNNPEPSNSSSITTAANVLPAQLRQLFDLPNVPQGNSGSITINTPQLKVADGGKVAVGNEGMGNGGEIAIEADKIALDRGSITAAVASGTGGKIDLVASALNLTNGGNIANDNQGVGDGGEIAIAARNLSISDRAFITTTTFGAGKGGDIKLKIAESLNINGIGFSEFQETFQTAALNGSLRPGTRGTGIFIGTAKNGRGGNLNIETNSLNLNSGGIIFSPIFADGIGGDITIGANAIEVVGSALQIDAGVNSTATAAAGKIAIDTETLMVRDGGTIVNATFGDAAGGDINIQADKAIELKFTPDDSRTFTGIYANTSIGNGKGGDVAIKTNSLAIDDGFISSSTGGFISDGKLAFTGGGDGGNISLEVTETINISGIPTDPRFASGISSTSFTDGAAGNITIATNRLLVKDGSEITATTIGSGDGGNLTITAADSVELLGTITSNNMRRGGLVAASGREAFAELSGDGASGSIKLTTDNLTVNNGASIDVQSISTGNAGNLDLEIVNTLALDNQGTISAATNSGAGGNIALDAGNIFWRGSSTTTARARGTADGGNIDIQGQNLVVLGSSQLTAEANQGRGGNINLDAQGLFICNRCLVSASSRLGIDGVVEVDTLEPDSNLDLVEVPIKLTKSSEMVALACSSSAQNQNRLTVNGRGGLPTRPEETLKSEAIVKMGTPKRQPSSTQQSTLPLPAQNWYENSQGIVVLTADAAITNNFYNPPDCHVR